LLKLILFAVDHSECGITDVVSQRVILLLWSLNLDLVLYLCHVIYGTTHTAHVYFCYFSQFHQ